MTSLNMASAGTKDAMDQAASSTQAAASQGGDEPDTMQQYEGISETRLLAAQLGMMERMKLGLTTHSNVY